MALDTDHCPPMYVSESMDDAQRTHLILRTQGWVGARSPTHDRSLGANVRKRRATTKKVFMRLRVLRLVPTCHSVFPPGVYDNNGCPAVISDRISRF